MTTREFTEEELSRPSPPSLEQLEEEKPATPDELLQRVANVFSVRAEDICSASHQRTHVRARHCLWRELRQLGWSSAEIGRFTGHDHTTVLVALQSRLRKCGARQP